VLQIESELEVVAAGIGTKSVQRRDYSQYVVKDMHAEVLARRAFIRYLIKKKGLP